MMKRLTPLLILAIFFSCGQNESPLHYGTSDIYLSARDDAPLGFREITILKNNKFQIMDIGFDGPIYSVGMDQFRNDTFSLTYSQRNNQMNRLPNKLWLSESNRLLYESELRFFQVSMYNEETNSH